METFFGEPIAHKNDIFPLEPIYGSGTMCILAKRRSNSPPHPGKVQIPHPLEALPGHGKMVWQDFRTAQYISLIWIHFATQTLFTLAAFNFERGLV